MKLTLIENPTNQIINIIRKKTSGDLAWKRHFNQSDQKLLRAAEVILDADPTPKKKYIKWLASLLYKGHILIYKAVIPPNPQIILPEDNQRVHEVINTFEKAKPRLPQNHRNILNFGDFYTLENLLDELVSTSQIKTGGMVKNIPEAEVIYNKKPYTIYAVKRIRRSSASDDPYSEEELQRIKAIEILGMGPPETKWCTRRSWGSDSMASNYLESNDMYVIYRDGVPFAQKCGTQLKDEKDRSTKLPVELEHYINQHEEQTQLDRIEQAKKQYGHIPGLIMSKNSSEPHKYTKIEYNNRTIYVIKEKNTRSHKGTFPLTNNMRKLIRMGIVKKYETFIDCPVCGKKTLEEHGPDFAKVPNDVDFSDRSNRGRSIWNLNTREYDRKGHDHCVLVLAQYKYRYFSMEPYNVVLHT